MNSAPIVVAGDWHGNLGWARTVVRSAAWQGVKTILQVGDFGALWPGKMNGRFEARLNLYLEASDIRLIFIAGNHDNWAELEKLPIDEDGLATLRSNIKYLPRPGRTTVQGLTVGGLGGAFSVDFRYRTEGKDWWAIEDLAPDHVAEFIAGGPVDILLTHDVPAGIQLRSGLNLPADVSARANVTRELLTQAVAATRPAHVFSGHWHQRRIDEIMHPDGSTTRVDVLNMENSRDGNAVLLWPGETPLRIEPLRISGS